MSKSFLLLLLCLCAFCDVTPCQQRGKYRGSKNRSSKKTLAKPRYTDPRLVPPSERDFEHLEKIESSYDRFKNETTVFMSMDLEERRAGYTLSLYVSFDFIGEDLIKRPQRIFISIGKKFRSYPHHGRFSNPTNLIALLDGGRVVVPMSTNRREMLGNWSDSAYELLSYNDFLLIANSTTVEMQLEGIEFQLTESHLEALRDFASRAIP